MSKREVIWTYLDRDKMGLLRMVDTGILQVQHQCSSQVLQKLWSEWILHQGKGGSVTSWCPVSVRDTVK